jgi:ATP-dependent helicase/nuclease subunit B
VSGVHREFLGWSQPALPQAADWLLNQYGADLAAVTIVLPGRRAGRRLMELLVQRAPAAWCPPNLATLAEVSDMLVAYPRPRVGIYQRILCWTLALQACSHADLLCLLSTPPAENDWPAWWKLAELLDRLHVELAAEALTFADILGSDHDGLSFLSAAPAQEVERWKVLLQVQNAYGRALEDAGVCDPHLERAFALRQGHFILPSTNLVLLGVASANRLQRQMISHLAHLHAVTSLVIAPHRLAHFFDDAGFLQVDCWQGFDLGLEEQQWRLVDSPRQQAEEVVRAISTWSHELAHDEITLGILDADHLSFVEEQLAEHGVAVRSPEGTALSQTPPLRLLLAVGAWIESQSFESFAALLRHPDVEDFCSAHLPPGDLIKALDDYFGDHLPQYVDGRWLQATPLALAHQLLVEQLGELATVKQAPAATWSARILALVQTFYGHRELDRSRESDRKLAVALQQLAAGAAEFAELGVSQGGRLPLTAGQALRFFVTPLLKARVAPGRTAAGSLEAVGWLELPLDDAPAIIVTDFREGAVPAPLGSVVFLPEALRTKLGMLSQEERLARDVYATTVLLNSRAQGNGRVLLLCCRQRSNGESSLPSRLLFHCDEELLAARAFSAFTELPPTARFAADASLRPFVLPGPRQSLPEPTAVFSASRLNTYLHAPYEYYLKYVCKMRSSDDQARELDPLNFGNLLHKVLEEYGRCDHLKEVCNPNEIADYLSECAAEQALRLFGARQRPTIQLQLLQMRHRLAHFAKQQAQLMEEGWRIHAVEWTPPGDSVELNFGNTVFRLQGRIDRVDYQASTGRWRIYDYKSGDAPREVKKIVKRSGVWMDVQLPLYHYLAQSLVGGRPSAGTSETVQIGYCNLPKSKVGPSLSLAAWDATAMSALEDQVAEAVEGIRAHDFFNPDQNAPRDARFGVLAGIGLLMPASVEAEDDETAGGFA